MNLSIRFSLLIFCVSVFCGLPARAEIMPQASIEDMCLMADLIVAGEHQGAGKVKISKLFYVGQLEVKDLGNFKEGAEITVPSIPEHTRKLFNWNPDKRQEIETKQLVLFLNMGEDGVLTPIWHIEQGSPGLIWFTDERCFGYTQIMNPGPYQLVESSGAKDAFPDFPHGKAALRQRIEDGIKSRQLLDDIRAIEQADRRAQALAMLLVKAGDPEGKFIRGGIGKELEKIGPDAVVGIADALERLEPDEDAWQLISALSNIASSAAQEQWQDLLRPTVAPLLKWLKTADKSTPYTPYHALGILMLANDKSCIPTVRGYLKHEDSEVRGMASEVLGSLGDHESFEAIAKLVETSQIKGPTGGNQRLIRGLFKLDAERATPLIQQMEKRPGNEGLGDCIPGFVRK